jgi:hypothetical protein
MQLVAYGAQDVYLTGNPQITFFKVVYRRHTNFSMEAMEQTVEGTTNFGQRLTCKIARNGDLVGRTYINVMIGGTDTSKSCNRIGFALLKEVELRVGGQLIDKHTGTWMNLWTELTHTNDQKILLDNLVGDSTAGRRINLDPTTNAALNVAVSNPISLARIPLQFSFCRNPGLALPLIALQYHEVELVINLANNESDITKDGTAAAGEITLSGLTLWCDYIFLDSEERKTFAQNPHEYLIETVQTLESTLTGTSQNAVRLPFNHPVKELVWVGIHQTASGANDTTTGDVFSNYTDSGTASKTNSISKATLRLNGQNRFSERNADYFNIVQPYQHHTGCPAVGINCYSFALNPEEHQPSGTCNFSRIDNAELVVTPASNVTKIKVFAHSYNVLRVSSGMGGLAYSN